MERGKLNLYINTMQTKVDREIVKAVHDDQFVQFLKNVNLYEKINQGRCSCKMCGKTITINNIYTIIPNRDKSISYICDEMSCVVKFSQKLED